MPSQYLANSLEVVISGTQGGREWANVYRLRNDTGGALDSALANLIGIEFVDFYDDNLNRKAADWYATRMVARNMAAAGGASFEIPLSIQGTAASGDSLLPPQVAACVTWRTAQAGRRFRGRTYLCGFAENANGTGGYMNSAVAAELEVSATALINALEAINTPLVVFSSIVPQHTDVESATVNDQWDIQRRRKT